MITITAEEYNKVKDDVRTVDVRTEQEYRILVRFNWAENIPIDELLPNIDKYFPDKEERIVIVCNAGNRSSEVAGILNSNGYDNAAVLLGGIYGYKRKFL